MKITKDAAGGYLASIRAVLIGLVRNIFDSSARLLLIVGILGMVAGVAITGLAFIAEAQPDTSLSRTSSDRPGQVSTSATIGFSRDDQTGRLVLQGDRSTAVIIGIGLVAAGVFALWSRRMVRQTIDQFGNAAASTPSKPAKITRIKATDSKNRRRR